MGDKAGCKGEFNNATKGVGDGLILFRHFNTDQQTIESKVILSFRVICITKNLYVSKQNLSVIN